MRLSLRVFLGFFLIVGLAAYFLLNTFLQEVKPGVRQGMEVALVDTANLLSEFAAEDLKGGTLAQGRLAGALKRYARRDPAARIWDISKRGTEFRVYVTDVRGILLFDSEGAAPGTDFSHWNDVQRTLRGTYGARSTRSDPADPSTSTMHVAAPVLDGSQLIGVLTVAAPTASVLPYAQRSQRRVLLAGGVLLGSALAIGLGLSWWLTRAIGRLQAYAREVSEDRKAALPSLGGGELAELGRALQTMREKLDGRRYVERYVHTLTHEMKSPLAGIRGAVELLEEEMPEADRRRFLTHIREQEIRLRLLLERMLELAAIEHRQCLQDPSRIALGPLVARVLASKEALRSRLGIRIESEVPDDAQVWGEAFLLEQALSNLLDNALDYSPPAGTLLITHHRASAGQTLSIRDQGPGIPSYALDRVMEPFYSLPRPATQARSTGLGLSFAAEVAKLHQGRVELSNHPDGGAEARLFLPDT